MGFSKTFRTSGENNNIIASVCGKNMHYDKAPPLNTVDFNATVYLTVYFIFVQFIFTFF